MLIQLKDGRKLSYQEQGEKGGTPIILLHGTPGSRIWFEGDDSVSRDLRVRTICPERPGYGLSDYFAGHSFATYPSDVEQLADALELEHFYLMGVSGGGAFAAACASALGTRVKAAALVSSTCPTSMIENKRGLSVANRVAFWLAAKFPPGIAAISAISRRLIFRNPKRYLEEIKGQFCEWDKAILETPAFQSLVISHLQEAYRQGVKGAVHELKLQCADWGFELGDIEIQTDVWHGQEDTLAPHSMGKILAERIKGAAFYSVPKVGHLLSNDPTFLKKIWTKLIGGSHATSVDNNQLSPQ